MMKRPVQNMNNSNRLLNLSDADAVSKQNTY